MSGWVVLVIIFAILAFTLWAVGHEWEGDEKG